MVNALVFAIQLFDQLGFAGEKQLHSWHSYNTCEPFALKEAFQLSIHQRW